MFESHGVPEDDLSVVPDRTAGGEKHLQSSDEQHLTRSVGNTPGHLKVGEK